MTNYYLNVYNAVGVLQFVVTDFTNLSYMRKVNSPGVLRFTVRGGHPILAQIADKWQVEVWRKPDGGAFARDFVGLFRMPEYSYGEKGPKTVLTCPGLMSRLAWRVVAWKAGTSNRSKFIGVPAETIMKTLVAYNAGASATVANGRLREGAITGLSIETDGAHGNSVDWFCAEEILLESLQKLATIAGGDFDLVKTGANTTRFHWYTGQLGTDRTATVIFGIERGNMANPQYRQLRIDEKTVAIVGGQGEEAAREFAIRTGANYSAGNDIEMFANASDVDTTAGLQARGDATLAENRATEQFNFDVLQTPATSYGEHYSLGDLVTAVNPFTKASMTLKIDEVTISVDESGKEKIDVRMA